MNAGECSTGKPHALRDSESREGCLGWERVGLESNPLQKLIFLAALTLPAVSRD
jgi:hypothetical protein